MQDSSSLKRDEETFSMKKIYRQVLEKKNLYLVGALWCGALLVGAVIIQYGARLVPCPLCVAQRIFFFFIGMTALIGYFGWPGKTKDFWISGMILVFSLFGGSIAFRQVWIQHFPPAGFDPTVCPVSLGSFFDSFLLALGGAGNCAIRDFVLFGFSLPEWSLLCFSTFTIISLWLIRDERARQPSQEGE